MKLPAFLQGIPQTAIILAVPVIAFLVTIGISLGTSGGGNDNQPQATAPTATATQLAAVAPTATPRPSPTVAAPTPGPNRANCGQITGSSYQSDTERDWFRQNCGAGAPTAAAGGTATARTNPAPSSGSSAPAPSTGAAAPSAPSGYAPGVEYTIGARLIIPAAGINATVTGIDVGPSGAMPDPVGYFNAVQYNFPYYPGLGGRNKVLAGHVDCGKCNNGGPGTAIFWSIRDTAVGSSAQYVNPDGSVTNYVVSASYAISAATDFSGIVASGAADMTIITCTGTFAGGHYDNRHVVTLTIV